MIAISPVEPGLQLAEQVSDDAPWTERGAAIIEGPPTRLEVHRVSARPTHFNAFLEGIQRARIKGYSGAIPIVSAYAAAVIRQRVDRRMRAHPLGLLIEDHAIFVPFRLLHPDQLAAAGFNRDLLVDTSPPLDEPLPLFPPVLYGRAAEAVSRWREGIERRLAARWAEQAPDEWLLADGSLTGSPELSRCARAVGLIKNHRVRFFDGEDASTLFSLRQGERTSVFAPQPNAWAPLHSWYLRLRDPAGHDVFWGLVRVEVAASDDPAGTADRVSGWLLAEQAPLALPHARWDRLLYPIHECEQFLRARAPHDL